MRDEKWHFSQTFLKQTAPIRIINVPTTCNHNIKSHGINIHNSLHYFYFLIKKFSTHKYFKFEHTSKLVVKFWPFVLLLWIPFNSYNIRSRNHKDGNIVSYQLLFTKSKASNVFYQHCCKVANIIHLNQLHVLRKWQLRIKWQCMCIISTQPICNYQDKSFGKSPIYHSDH
jgi:hypothetical protein